MGYNMPDNAGAQSSLIAGFFNAQTKHQADFCFLNPRHL